MSLHPASQLLTWLLLIIILQSLPLPALLACAVLLLPPMLFKTALRQRFGRLLQRIRWLLLSIALLFVFATPGQPWPRADLPFDLTSLGMTLEGLELASLHSLRLILLLVLLAWLLEHLSTSALISGLYVLLGPWAWLAGRTGARSRNQMVVRLRLVLDYVEARRSRKETTAKTLPGDWKRWLADDDDHETSAPSHLVLELQPLRTVDRVCLVLSSGLIILFILRAMAT